MHLFLNVTYSVFTSFTIMNKIWNYEVNHYYTEPKAGTLDNFKLKGKYNDDCTALFELVGTFPHPSMRLPVGKEHVEPTYLSFSHILIDINTVKIMLNLLANSKIISLKFNSNNFEISVLESLVNGLLTKNNSVYTIVFEWNHCIKLENSKEVVSWVVPIYKTDPHFPLDNSKESVSWVVPLEKTDPYFSLINRAYNAIGKFGLSTKIESLCLRGNYLGDDAILILVENLKNNNVLRVLNLYNNCMTSRSFSAFCGLLELNKKIEEINFGKNFLVDEDLVTFKRCVGKFLMTQEEVEIHQKKIKDRDAIIEKNKKLKNQRKPEEPVPVLEEMAQIGDSFYIIRNTKLKSVNFMQNRFKSIFELVILIFRQTDSLFMTLDHALFDKEQRHNLTYPSIGQNFSSRIYLSK